MRIGLTCKYPPIQGGESTKAYWLTRELGARGHQVTIFSNWREVSPVNKVSLLPQHLSDVWPPANVNLRSTDGGEQSRFIPFYEPRMERLASLILHALDEDEIDVLIGWYLLPYGAACAVSAWNARLPYVLQHAGSDLERLLADHRLSHFLKRIIQRAHAVWTYPSSERLFESLGCERILVHRPGFPDQYSPDGVRADLSTLAGAPVDGERTLLFLGKLERGKGVFELLKAFASVTGDYYLLFVGAGTQREALVHAIHNHGLSSRVYIIPPLPPWKIPELLRAVKALAIPEYNFGVPIHRSRLPIEAMLCGCHAIVSSEIAPKYGELIAFARVADPGDCRAFGATIYETLRESRPKTQQIASLRAHLPAFAEYVDHLESYLCELVRQ